MQKYYTPATAVASGMLLSGEAVSCIAASWLRVRHTMNQKEEKAPGQANTDHASERDHTRDDGEAKSREETKTNEFF